MFRFVIVISVVVIGILVRSRASNPPIEDTDLGITARACAANFCKSKDALELWMDIEFECHTRDLLAVDLFTTNRKRKLIESTSYTMSSVHVGLLCGLFGVFGYYFGNACSTKYFSGGKKGNQYEYTQIPTSDPLPEFNSSYENSSGSYH